MERAAPPSLIVTSFSLAQTFLGYSGPGALRQPAPSRLLCCARLHPGDSHAPEHCAATTSTTSTSSTAHTTTSSSSSLCTALLSSFVLRAQVFDITRKVTYTNLSKWYAELQENRPSIPCIVVANKIDRKALGEYFPPQV